MRAILSEAEHLKGTEVYSALDTAGRYMTAFRRGMLTVEELDAMKLLRPCVEMRKTDARLGRLAAEELRDFCLEVDRYTPVDRRFWTVLGQMLYEDPFFLLDEYDVSVIREEAGTGDGALMPWDFLYLEANGLWIRMTDPPLYASAYAYIKRQGRARFTVRRWLTEDVDRRFGDRPKPTFPAKQALSFRMRPGIRFHPGKEPREPWHRGMRVKLFLTDEQEMDFFPEVRILSDRSRGAGREARAWGWYHNDRWLLRILYDPQRPEEALAERYILYPLEFAGFHVLAFIVLDGNYRRRKPLGKGDAVRMNLMDLWGGNVPLRGKVTEAKENAFDFRAVFPDGRERGVTVYLAQDADGYRWDVAVVNRWEQYPLPAWAEKES